jgi:hypothetical protein
VTERSSVVADSGTAAANSVPVPPSGSTTSTASLFVLLPVGQGFDNRHGREHPVGRQPLPYSASSERSMVASNVIL